MKEEKNLKVWNRLFLNKGHIAAELKSTNSNLRRWVVIFPNVGKNIDQNLPDHNFYIVDFELNKNLVDEYFGEEDKLNQKKFYLNTEHEIYSLLDELKVDYELFDSPWKCDCPL